MKPVQRRIIRTRAVRAQKPRVALRLFLAAGVLLALFSLVIFSVMVSVMGAGVVAANKYYQSVVPNGIDTLVTLEKQRIAQTQFYDRTGKHLLAVLYDANRGFSKPVHLKEISQWLQLATIDVEDASFYDNPGFDPRGITRALFQNLRQQGTLQGGSSITQQLVKTTVTGGNPTFQRKINEVMIAYGLTQKFSGNRGKQAILETYLNSIPYGNQCKGIEAAAQFYFHKSAANLDLAQSALLAGVPNGPTYYDPVYHLDRALERQRTVLTRMVHQGDITTNQEQQAIEEAQSFPAFAPRTFKRQWFDAPHWVDYVRTQLINDLPGHEEQLYSGLKVITTLDFHNYKTAQILVQQQTNQLSATGHNAHDGAVVAIDPRTREILCMVGSANWHDPTKAGAGQYNMAVHPRQPGSSFKPFTYITAFEQGYFPAKVVLDTPVSYPDGGEPYTPHNYDLKYHGAVTLRFALANSFNVPAVELLNHVGIDNLLQTVANFGMPQLQETQRHRRTYGLSLVLGSAEVSLLQMTNAYAVFADGGIYAKPKYVVKITDVNGQPVHLLNQAPPRRVMAPQYTYQMTSILSDGFARSYEFGVQSPLVLPGRPAAVKTGTTNDFKDNLTIGYTPSLVTGVWVGNADDTKMYDVIGIDGAGPIWQNFMSTALADGPVERFVAPLGMVTTTVSGYSGLLATNATRWRIRDVFAPGQVPHHFDYGLYNGNLYNIMGEMSLDGSQYTTYEETAGAQTSPSTPLSDQPTSQTGTAGQPNQPSLGTFHSTTKVGNLCNGRAYHWEYDPSGGYIITCQ